MTFLFISNKPEEFVCINDQVALSANKISRTTEHAGLTRERQMSLLRICSPNWREFK
jgi:hypothetical protein